MVRRLTKEEYKNLLWTNPTPLIQHTMYVLYHRSKRIEPFTQMFHVLPMDEYDQEYSVYIIDQLEEAILSEYRKGV